MSLLLSRSNQYKLIGLFGLWALHGVIAVWQLVKLPSDGHDFLFGQSISRVLICGILLFWLVLNLILMVHTARNTLWFVKYLEAIQKPRTRDTLLMLAILAVFFGICLVITRGLLGQQLTLHYAPYIDRLLPIVMLIAWVSFEIIILVSAFNLRLQAEYKKPFKTFVIRMFVVFAGLGLVAAMIACTGLGIGQSYEGDWSRGLPAVPLLEWQIFLAFILCFGMVLFETRSKILNFPRLDLWICVIIWLGTVVLWLSQPVMPNASALKPHEPNFEIYPFIDAQTYDEFAQSVLVGNGFGENRIPQRPLYIVFLSLIHAWVGQDYNNMVIVQTLFFAIFPVLLYLTGSKFFGRPVGISMALLALLRDHTSNLVSSFAGNISYSKLYLSEIPTAIFLILFMLVGMRWIRAGFPIFLGMLMGGILGAGMLIRTQVIVALPAMLLFAYLMESKKIALLVKNALLMVMTLVLVISPWLWRNWRMTGEIVFDSPESQTINLALRYSRLNGIEPDVLPQAGESSMQYSDRLKQIAFDAISSNPSGAIWAVANSFLNHAVNNILLFPLRDGLETFNELWVPSDAFWEKWDGIPTFTQAFLLAFYVFLFGLGLTTAWLRNGWLGFLPLGLNLGYNLWTSLALLSGQRFMLTMDWSIYLYYMIGLFAFVQGILFSLESGRGMILKWRQTNSLSIVEPLPEIKRQVYVLAGVCFFVIGLSLPLSEMIFPRRYPSASQEQMLNSVISSPAVGKNSDFGPVCLKKVVNEYQLNTAQGRVLYPRYYRAGDGENFTDSIGYKITGEGRLVFNMVGQINGRIIFPMSQSPEFFPNAADAVLISGRDGEPWFVLVSQGDREGFYVSESFDYSICE